MAAVNVVSYSLLNVFNLIYDNYRLLNVYWEIFGMAKDAEACEHECHMNEFRIFQNINSINSLLHTFNIKLLFSSILYTRNQNIILELSSPKML